MVATLDWVFLGVLLASLAMGIWRGLIYEVLSLAGWVAAFFVARWGGEFAGLYLPLGDVSDALRSGAGFLLLFVLVAFLGGFVAWSVRKGAGSIGLRPIDRAFGAAFGLARGAALLLVCAILVGLTPARQSPWWTQSLGAHWLERALVDLREWTPIPPAAASATLWRSGS
ncbi:MAG: CvpA family protein [Burkholderiaceae bacterium]|jgi:membrane protein required for colicin V production|nr:CvpA family protein [Burkholderiaceae bacterium]